MADDSELDYIKTYLTYSTYLLQNDITVNHFSEVKKISVINASRRILIYPGELLHNDGKFYTKRYKIKLSDTSESEMISMLNAIINGLDSFNKQTYHTTQKKSYSFYVGDEMSNPRSIAWDGTYFWVLGTVNHRVYKYSSAGVYQDTSVLLTGEMDDPTCFTFDGTYFWVLDDNAHRVHKYASDWTYLSLSYDIRADTCWYYWGICWDGTNFWIASDCENLMKFSDAWVLDTIYDLADGEVGTGGLAFDGQYLWLINSFNDGPYRTLSKYGLDGIYTGTTFRLSGGTDQNYGVLWKTPYFYITESFNKTVDLWIKTTYTQEPTMVYISLQYGNKGYEQPKTKRWEQDIYLDVEWCTE